MRAVVVFSSVAVVLTALAACSATNGSNDFNNTGGDDSSGNGPGSGGSGGIDLGGATGSGGGPLQQEPSCDGVDPNIDNDGDGWTGAAGDCNDCTAQMNPGAQDYPGNNIDEDCNDAKDDNPTACDQGLAVGSNDPIDAAKAIGLCKMQQGASWGVIKAEYVTADGTPLSSYDPQGTGHGILPDFGPNVHPQEGANMLALSSGTARRPNDPGYDDVGGHDKGYTTGAPPGYPKESPACPNVTTGEPHDSAGFRVQIQTPTNAKSLKFNLDFYTFEFPNFICSEYNDFFVAMLTPKPAAQPDGNISFDENGNTISVNAGFLAACTPQTASNNQPFACPLGPSQLSGTGFDQGTNSAATGWLETAAPIEQPGQNITLHFAIWDSGDGVLDSTVLIDNFAFDVNPADTETAPVPVPK
jgi:hypothetical protein